MRKFKISIAIFSLIVMFMLGGFLLVLFAGHDSNKKIVTTNFAIYDMCREIMGSDEDIILLGGGVDMHGYQPTAHDVIKVANCEAFIHIGGESDNWVEDIIETAKNNDIIKVELREEIELICNERDEHHNHEGHNHEFDEHIWLSIKNMITMADSVYDTLSLIYPEKEDEFFANKNIFVSKLIALDEEFTNTFSNIPSTMIIADRFPFTYLFNDYGINYYSLFEGCSAESEASPETMTNFINTINSLQVEYIFNLETSSIDNASRIISSSNCKDDVKILTLNSIQSIQKDKISSTSYIEIMQENLENLRKAI